MDIKSLLRTPDGHGILPRTVADQVITNPATGERLNTILDTSVTYEFTQDGNELSGDGVIGKFTATSSGTFTSFIIKGITYGVSNNGYNEVSLIEGNVYTFNLDDTIDKIHFNVPPVLNNTYIDLIWENPDVSANFPEQDVYGNFGDYDFLIFISNHYWSQGYEGEKFKTSTFLPFIDGGNFILTVPGWTLTARRILTYTDHIHFYLGSYYPNYSNTNPSANEAHPTPWRIYGLKIQGNH